MDSLPFERISNLFSTRRTRREAMQQGAAGLAVAGLAAAGLKATAAAQDSTPAADAADEKIEYLFVQSFESGSIEAKDAEAGTYTVTLQHGLGQTIYFSDRPERIVGASPTGAFLEGLGFGHDNPPNAALVIAGEDGTTDVAVVELTNPVYDEGSATASYDIALLENFSDVDMSFQPDPVDLSQVAASFGAAHLFIDSCADQTVGCYRYDGASLAWDSPHESLGVKGFCYQWWPPKCLPCGDYNAECYSTFPDFCNDAAGLGCAADWVGSEI